MPGLARNRRAKNGNRLEPQLYRELKANYDDSTETETLFPYAFERKDPIDSEADFVTYCGEWFLFFEDDHSNAFISQGDLIDFIMDVCTVFDGEDIPDFDCPSPTFRTISDDVQFMFVKRMCEGKDVAVCLQSILDLGKEFGYNEDLTKSSFLDEFCCDLVPFISLVGLRNNSGKLIRSINERKNQRTTVSHELFLTNNVGCLQSPTTVQFDSSSAPSPILSLQPNEVVTSPTASPVALGPTTVNSRPIDESQPSPLPVSNHHSPSRPSVGPEASPSFTPTISKDQQVPSVTVQPMSDLPVMSSSPPIRPSSHPSSNYHTPFPWNSLEPTHLRTPLQPTGSPPGSNAISNGQASSSDAAITRNSISVAAILGIVLGFGALLLLGVVSSLRRARKRDFAMVVLANPRPTETGL